MSTTCAECWCDDDHPCICDRQEEWLRYSLRSRDGGGLRVGAFGLVSHRLRIRTV